MIRQRLLRTLILLTALLMTLAIGAIVGLQGIFTSLDQMAQSTQDTSSQAYHAYTKLTSEFRYLVIGIGVGFLLVINISVLVLMQSASKILKPIDQLVEASRELAKENFSHRVTLREKDEFAELAKAYNQMAQQLEQNEERKIEMLGQIALTLNHELNNAIAIINLQLQLLKRQTTGDTSFEKYLLQIHQTLDRMTKTVRSLTNIRQIVLTDYAQGLQMIDLERSVQKIPTDTPFQKSPNHITEKKASSPIFNKDRLP